MPRQPFYCAARAALPTIFVEIASPFLSDFTVASLIRRGILLLRTVAGIAHFVSMRLCTRVAPLICVSFSQVWIVRAPYFLTLIKNS